MYRTQAIKKFRNQIFFCLLAFKYGIFRVAEMEFSELIYRTASSLNGEFEQAGGMALFVHLKGRGPGVVA